MPIEESGKRPKTDRELIEEFRSGRVEGFNELVKRYQQKIYWVARRMVGSHDEADDVVQDVFVRVYDALKSFRGEANFYTWLYRITVNVSLNALRSKRVKDFFNFEEVEEQLSAPEDSADRKILKEEYQTILDRAVERLPAKQKMVFTMRYYGDMDYEEMAKVLKKSVGGLKANYFHALKKIQKFVRREMSS